MEKRFVYFLILTILFFVSYSFLISKYEQKPPLPHIPSSENAITPVKEEPSLAVPESEKLIEAETEKFIITYSLTGGYIKKIKSKKYNEELNFQNIGYIPEDQNITFEVHSQGDKTTLTSPEGAIKKHFIFDGYQLTMKLENIKKPTQGIIFCNALKTNTLDQRYQEVFFKENGMDSPMKRKHLKKVKPLSINAVVIGARDRYFCCALFGNNYKATISKDKENQVLVEAIVEPNFDLNLYIGPQLKEQLAKLGLDDIIYYGFFNSIALILGKLLYFFVSVTKSWGFSIIILSVLIYIILFPFTAKSTKSMRQMQALQPSIEALKEKYKDAPQKLNKELMGFYRTHKINPLGGCLPLFFQFPVFISLYQMLLRFVELKGTSFLWIKDLSLPDRAFTLPFSLPFAGNYINVLPLIIMVLSIIQQKFISPSSAQSQQKQMGLFFAVFIGVIFYNFPSCVVLYWFVQNLLTLLYQVRTGSSMGTPATPKV